MSHQDDNNKIDTKKNLTHMANIMAEMRKDLGLKNDKLGKNGAVLMRAILKDYDQMFFLKNYFFKSDNKYKLQQTNKFIERKII